MVKVVCILISVIAMFCIDKFDKTIKYRYVLAFVVLVTLMFMLVLKKDLW